MAIYHYDIAGDKPFADDQGLESVDDAAAWREAISLTRDIEDNLKPDGSWSLTVRQGSRVVYLIQVTASIGAPKN